MSNEVSSKNTITSEKAIVSPARQYCDMMEKCYPPIDLKRMLIGLCGVAVLFVIAAFVV